MTSQPPPAGSDGLQRATLPIPDQAYSGTAEQRGGCAATPPPGELLNRYRRWPGGRAGCTPTRHVRRLPAEPASGVRAGAA
jgi:hypothetical protein